MLWINSTVFRAVRVLARRHIGNGSFIRASSGVRDVRGEVHLVVSLIKTKDGIAVSSFLPVESLVSTYRCFSSSLGGGREGNMAGYSGGFSYPASASSNTVFQGSSSIPQGLELQRGHHLQSSVGLHSPIMTACGRSFDPQIYYEVLQACCDPQWMSAIQRELRTDSEYTDHLRSNGGVASDVRAITESVHHDDDLMIKLKDRLKTDVGVSLALCAIQDSYLRIRKKRDQHETQVAADGGMDPYATMKNRQKGEFGSQQPKFQ